jgi:hypothetical protein
MVGDNEERRVSSERKNEKEKKKVDLTSNKINAHTSWL